MSNTAFTDITARDFHARGTHMSPLHFFAENAGHLTPPAHPPFSAFLKRRGESQIDFLPERSLFHCLDGTGGAPTLQHVDRREPCFTECFHLVFCGKRNIVMIKFVIVNPLLFL